MYKCLILVILFLGGCGRKSKRQQFYEVEVYKQGKTFLQTLEKKICALSWLLTKAQEVDNDMLKERYSNQLSERVAEYHILQDVRHDERDFSAVLLTAAYLNYCHYNRMNTYHDH